MGSWVKDEFAWRPRHRLIMFVIAKLKTRGVLQGPHLLHFYSATRVTAATIIGTTRGDAGRSS
jgi:hypothetical protein